MRTRTRTLPLLTPLELAMALAMVSTTCGDGDGASQFNSGVDKGAELGSLGQSDVDKLCREAEAWTNENVGEILCRFSGIVAASLTLGGNDAQLQTSCKSAYDMCRQESTSGGGMMNMCEKFPTTCKATVGELEACLSAMGAALADAGKSLPTCDKVTQASLNNIDEMPGNFEEPAACKALEQKCPDLELPELPD